MNDELQSKEEMTQQCLERGHHRLEYTLLVCAHGWWGGVSPCVACKETSNTPATPKEEIQLDAKEQCRGELWSKRLTLGVNWGCSGGLLAPWSVR